MYPHGQPAPQDGSRKFLNLSGGMLALVIALVLLVPILCCAGCYIAIVTGMIFDGQSPPTDY